MSLSLAKLQQLKRQAGGSMTARPGVAAASAFASATATATATESTSGSAPAPALASTAAAAGSAPAKVPELDQLRRLLRVRARPQAIPAGGDRQLPGEQVAPGLYLVEEQLHDDALPAWFDGTFDRGDTIDPHDLLFFDTETTGLAGGTGTRAFMVGVADWHQSRLRIRQLTIASISAEAAMLDMLASWVQPRSVLCSYNGKCYDAPLLATRYRLARRAHPLAGLRHVDLLYPTRRRYRGVYENCRLATIERQVLKVVREDDLPGSEAPAAWLGYLRGGGSALLRRVLAHNRQDVISLSRLLRHLSAMEAVTPLEAAAAVGAATAP